jgi:hypothetical protein
MVRAARTWGVHKHSKTNCDIKSVDPACNRLDPRFHARRGAMARISEALNSALGHLPQEA